MKCPSCGYDIADNEQKCQNCGQELGTDARPMSRQEIEAFEGITIESGENKEYSESGHERGRTYNSQDKTEPRVYVKQFNMGGMMGTLLVGALIIAFIFFVLPTLLLIGLAVVAVWLVVRMFI